ncbi:hypothetical protein EVAR_96078_1 [Eumeta japonica]|uniref:Uncharacterized protein n=1 Tax=Eumeta variegata TaxID=151549 RepID=A0A4C1VDX6_EUMVA|nr:hypothetical protein EVAR_96078_1 [Eumeta japonica]
MDTRNPRGLTDALPASWAGIGFLMERDRVDGKGGEEVGHWNSLNSLSKINSGSCYFESVFGAVLPGSRCGGRRRRPTCCMLDLIASSRRALLDQNITAFKSSQLGGAAISEVGYNARARARTLPQLAYDSLYISRLLAYESVRVLTVKRTNRQTTQLVLNASDAESDFGSDNGLSKGDVAHLLVRAGLQVTLPIWRQRRVALDKDGRRALSQRKNNGVAFDSRLSCAYSVPSLTRGTNLSGT